MNTFSCIGTWLTPFTIEKFGRRTIMLWGAVLLSIFMLIFLVMVNIGETDKRSDATQWTAVGAVIAYVFTFGYSWVGVPWLYGPEVGYTTDERLADDLPTDEPSPLDCTVAVQTLGRIFQRHRRMEHDLCHRLRGRYRTPEFRRKVMDLVHGLQ